MHLLLAEADWQVKTGLKQHGWPPGVHCNRKTLYHGSVGIMSLYFTELHHCNILREIVLETFFSKRVILYDT